MLMELKSPKNVMSTWKIYIFTNSCLFFHYVWPWNYSLTVFKSSTIYDYYRYLLIFSLLWFILFIFLCTQISQLDISPKCSALTAGWILSMLMEKGASVPSLLVAPQLSPPFTLWCFSSISISENTVQLQPIYCPECPTRVQWHLKRHHLPVTISSGRCSAAETLQIELLSCRCLCSSCSQRQTLKTF